MKIFYSVFILFVIFFMNVQAIVQESASLKDFLYGQTEACAYDNWISHISEGIVEEGYNVYAPYDRQTNDFGAFYIPDEDELDHWETIAGFFASQSYEIVDVYFDVYDFPFEVVEFFDEDTQRTYYLIRELLNLDYIDDNGTDNTYDDEIGSFDYGWGLFVVNPEASYPVLITAPHPNDDYLTVAVALKCFQDWDAYGLFISGAGREVAWTEEGTYSNSKSLSDPSRNEDHPFNIIYRKFCDLLRTEFNRREFSAQIHSYDWNAHIGYPDCQVSAGWGKYCPNLPIRDLSDLKIDLINASSHLMVPANTVGLHQDVYLNDFYGVNYSLYDFTFSDEDTTYSVNNNIDLPGYSQNQQMLYTFDGWNRYDVFEPFFHLEMDELPGCYQQSEANWKWFYSYLEDLQIFQMDQLFTNTLNFYQGWIDAMTEILPVVLELNDQVDPPTPAEFRISESQFDTITLNWEPVSSFDFRTFEIIYADEPLSHLNHNLVDREVTSILASPLHITKTINSLEGSQNYYFKIRTQDYNGNYSEYSPEITTITSPADIADFIAIGKDDQSELLWEATEQIGNLGFKIYRREGTGNFELLASYLTHPELLGSSEPDLDYQFFDLTAQNDIEYTYQLASVNESESEFIYTGQPSCSPRRIYSLIISNLTATLADTVHFSANPYATNGFDQYYDLPDPGYEPPDYIQAAFYEANWQPGNRFLAQEIHYDFNPELDYRTWNLITTTDQQNVLFNISVGADYPRDGEKLYLREEASETMVDLTSQDYNYYSTASDTVNFRLFWGNLLPVAY
ncbi:MAG: fibronectin type III domain-containing protein, partial [Candidatus Cloacimonetes bacterium]|nr:fibronectin type III domain-containing protein [Candidatus Cloacimonadota bacterium]